MADDPNQVVVLTAVPTEAQAEMIVAALEARSLQARTTGAVGTLNDAVPVLLRRPENTPPTHDGCRAIRHARCHDPHFDRGVLCCPLTSQTICATPEANV